MVNPRISVVFRGFHSDILINPYGFNLFAIYVFLIQSPFLLRDPNLSVASLTCLFL